MEGETPVGILTERDFIKKFSMDKKANSEMLVTDLMTKGIVSVDPSIDLFQSQKLMRQHNFRKLVVVHNNELKGIITQTDLCRAVAKLKSPILNSPLIKEVMTKSVLTAADDDTFLKAKKIMAAKDIGSVIVGKGNDLHGIFTEFDLVSEYFMNPNKLMNSQMSELVSAPIICIEPDFDLVFVNKMMLERNFRRLPVIENTNLIGIITQTDVARALYSFIENNKDAAIKRSDARPPSDYELLKTSKIILCRKKQPKAVINNQPTA
jgi:CBS domain-containing protein